MDGGGTLPGSVIIADSGVLSLGTSTGTSTITIGSLKLQAGSTVDDNVGSQDYLAQITGALTINGGTVKTANGGAAGSVPYQVLFQYGWLTSNGGAGFSNLSSNSDLINNLPASSIDVLLSGTPLYWAASGPGSFGGNGEWDGASGNWLTSPTGGTANWTDGDVAIFEGTGTVTLADGFTAKPAAMLFVGGNYQIVTSGSTTNPGKISEPTGATTILVALASGLQATISPAVACGNLIADLPDGALILNGDESNVANATVNCTSAGTLQLGDGSSDDLLPGSAAAGSIVFNNSSTAPASLIFDTSTLDSLSASRECYYGISGNATITEDGPGSLTLNEADTNAGGTVVTSGTLVATNPEAIPNGWSLTVGYGTASLFGSAQENQALPPTLPINTREDTGSDSNPPAPTAGLSFVITGTDGQTNFDVPSTGGSYPLIVFALIQDADGQPDPLGNDGLMAAEVGASLTGTLVGSGNAYFKTNASGTPQVRYQPGASATASAPATWGSGNTIGIGASDQTTTAGPVENTLYLGTANVWSPANGIAASLGADANTWSTDDATYATLAGYPGYTAIPIVKFTVSFSTALPAGESATLTGISGSVNGNGMRGVDIWSEAGVSYEQNGNNDVQTANGALSPGNLNGFLNTVSFSTEGYGDNLAAGVASTSLVCCHGGEY